MCFTKKGLFSGIAAGVLFIILSFIWNMIVPGRSAWYIQAFPGMASMLGMILLIVSFFIPGLVMGFAYEVVEKAMPWRVWKKGFVFGVGAWLLAGIMWPLMMISYAPMMLWVSEFIVGFIGYSLVGITIYCVFKKIK